MFFPLSGSLTLFSCSYLTVCPATAVCLTTLDYFFLNTLSTSAPQCFAALPHSFFPSNALALFPTFSQALLISAWPSLDGEQPFYTALHGAEGGPDTDTL